MTELEQLQQDIADLQRRMIVLESRSYQTFTPRQPDWVSDMFVADTGFWKGPDALKK